MLEAVLEVADSAMTYRRRYLGSLQAEAVLDLLLADETNPRSLASQLAALADDVDHLPRPARGPGRAPEQRLALAALTPSDWPSLSDWPRAGWRPAGPARSCSTTSRGWLPILSDAITQQYLSHLQTSRHLAEPEPIRRTGADSGDRL